VKLLIALGGNKTWAVIRNYDTEECDVFLPKDTVFSQVNKQN